MASIVFDDEDPLPWFALMPRRPLSESGVPSTRRRVPVRLRDLLDGDILDLRLGETTATVLIAPINPDSCIELRFRHP